MTPDVRCQVARTAEVLAAASDVENLDRFPEEQAGERSRARHSGPREERAAARWLAKRLVLEAAGAGRSLHHGDEPLILSRDGLGRPQRPRAFLNGRALPGDLSISHARGLVAAAYSAAPGISVGVDLEARDEPAPGGAWWLSPREAERQAGRPGEGALPIMQWAAKEAIFKAVNRGEAFIPRRYEVDWSPHGGWSTTTPGLRLLVSEVGGHVLVLAVHGERAWDVSVEIAELPRSVPFPSLLMTARTLGMPE